MRKHSNPSTEGGTRATVGYNPDPLGLRMAKTRTQYVCQQCGRTVAKPLGRCPQCGEWNSMVEEMLESTRSAAPVGSGTSPQTSANRFLWVRNMTFVPENSQSIRTIVRRIQHPSVTYRTTQTCSMSCNTKRTPRRCQVGN